MKRATVAVMVAGAAWMGLAKEAQAQSIVTPTGPLSIDVRIKADASDFTALYSDRGNFYPGRTMGGGTRILRSSPPPSSLKRWKK